MLGFSYWSHWWNRKRILLSNKFIKFKEFARQGVNVCIVARNRSKAENLIEELKKINDKP